jgi:hypothetical protein
MPDRQPVSAPQKSSAKSAKLGAFFASQAMLCLVTLMVFVGLLIALAPVGLSYLQQAANPAQGTQAGATRGLDSRAGNTACNPILVSFADTISMAQISKLLGRLDASIAFGPNENGAFELAVPKANAGAVVDALNRMPDAVVIASLREQCL